MFFPIVQGLELGIPSDLVGLWFGILVLSVVGIGLTAPPMGLNVFVVSAIARDIPIQKTYRGVMPFLWRTSSSCCWCCSFPFWRWVLSARAAPASRKVQDTRLCPFLTAQQVIGKHALSDQTECPWFLLFCLLAKVAFGRSRV